MNAGPPTQMSVSGSSFLSASTACRTASRWKWVDELMTIASTPSALARRGDLLDRRVRPQEVRAPAGHVEPVGDHAQTQVVGLFGRAGQEHRAPGRGDPAFALSTPGYTISTMVRTVALARCSSQMAVSPRCHASPVSARMRESTSR